MPGRLCLLLALLHFASACDRAGALPPIAKLELAGATVQDNGLLGLTPNEVEALLRRHLQKEGGFTFESEKKGELSMSLELEFTRETRREGAAESVAEVGAELNLRRTLKEHEGTARYKLGAIGEAPVSGSTPEARRAAMAAALEAAIVDLSRGARLQLLALKKSDGALTADLKDGDARVREFAMRALAERDNPAAVPELVSRLQSEDPAEVRRAMGGLVGMKSQAAVPAIIEAGKGKDLGFQREVLFAIAAIGGDEAQAYLFTVAQGHDQEVLRQAATAALEELGQRPVTRKGFEK